MSPETMMIIFEGVLVFGGAMAFGIWQLRSIKRDQEAARARRAAEPQEIDPK
jgi:hypothetical protein